MSSKEKSGGGLPALAPESGPKTWSVNLAGIPIPLRRTFGAIDKLISIPLEALGDKIEKKMKSNVDAHVEAVQETRKKRGKKKSVDDPSIRTTMNIGEWASIAAEIDPSEETLSAVWRSILDQILDDQDTASELLQIVKRSRPSDIRTFIDRFAERRDTYVLRGLIRTDNAETRLKDEGLIERPYDSFTALFITMVVAIYSGIAYVLLQRFGFRGDSPYAGWLSSPFVLIILAVFMIINVAMYRLYRPTMLGYRLIEFYGDYRHVDKPSSPRNDNSDVSQSA